MNRTELILATAIILFVAFALGWFANWFVNRFTRVTAADMGELDRMSQALHEAEEARDEAVEQLHKRESEISGKLAEKSAELRAAMEGLRDARHEAEELRTYIEKHSKGRG